MNKITSNTVQTDLNGRLFEEMAISRIREYEPSDGYYLAFSGGKDSVVIYDLAERAGVTFDAHFSRTTLDPPEVLTFIKNYYPDVIWEKPRKSMFQLIREKQMLPTRTARFCCHALIEIGGPGRVVMLGLRHEESVRRRKRKVYEESRRDRGKFFLNPILEWTNIDVWSYIRKRGLPYCSLYDMGYSRIGCIMCPLQSVKGIKMDIKRYPKYYNAFMRVISELVEVGRYGGMTPNEVMDWWTKQKSGRTKKGE